MVRRVKELTAKSCDPSSIPSPRPRGRKGRTDYLSCSDTIEAVTRMPGPHKVNKQTNVKKQNQTFLKG